MFPPFVPKLLHRASFILAVPVNQIVIISNRADLILDRFVELEWDLWDAVLAHDTSFLDDVFHDRAIEDAEAVAEVD